MQTLTIPITEQVLAALWPVWLRLLPPVAELSPRCRLPYCRARQKRQTRQILREWGVA